MKQLVLPFAAQENPVVDPKDRNLNRVHQQDKAFHDWYRFVLSYPPHLVRTYIEDFALDGDAKILDPFCGTGTTVVESKLNGLAAIGIEANPIAHFASNTKLKWDVNAEDLRRFAVDIADETNGLLHSEGIEDSTDCSDKLEELSLRRLGPDAEKLLIKNSMSPLPLHKSLTILNVLNRQRDPRFRDHCLLALAKTLVFHASNLRFGPEIGVGKSKADAPVVAAWLSEVEQMATDVASVSSAENLHCQVYRADSRDSISIIQDSSIDAVITSPPYPNEKDYTRTTRLESVVLGFMKNKAELRQFKKDLLRSNTRGVYKADNDDRWVENNQRVAAIADRIEQRRIELNKTSGFERLYGRVTKLYFGGMARHLSEMRRVLKPGARLAYVVGDQASYLRIMIHTGQILAEIAEELGYEVDRIDLFRTRAATATREELREEVVILRWSGKYDS